MRRLIIAITFLLGLGMSALAHADPKTPQEWELWLNGQIDRCIEAAHSHYQASQGGAMVVYAEVVHQAVVQNRLRDNPYLMERFKNFFDFVDVIRLPGVKGHSLGFTVSDVEYFRGTTRFTDIPAELRDQNLLRWAGNEATLPQAKQYLAKLNESLPPERKLTYFSYSSQFLGTPDRSDVMGRLLVVAPDPQGIDKWVQYGVTSAGDTRRVRNVSVLGVERNADGSHTPYFKDHYRTYNGDGSISLIGRFEASGKVEACYECHKMGVAAIFPAHGSVPAEELGRVDEVNRMIRKYGRVDYKHFLPQAHFGPGLGQIAKFEVEKLKLITPNAEKIQKAMNCAACHQGRTMQELTVPIKKNFTGKWVLSGKMPPGQDLADPELRVVHDVLVKEYFGTAPSSPGVLKRWLTHQALEFRTALDPVCRDLLLQQEFSGLKK